VGTFGVDFTIETYMDQDEMERVALEALKERFDYVEIEDVEEL
jgi:hypothetical protein